MGELVVDDEHAGTVVLDQASEAGSSITTVAAPLDPAEASLQPGDRVGRYVLVRRLGAGGMGVVWVARDPSLQRTVAVKVLHEQRRGSASRAHERMRREAMALARLSHPNVVAIYDVGIHERRVYLTMEHIEGRTLDAWVQDGPGLDEVLDVFQQAAAGLAAVHEAGFVHRDFKPANVMIDREGRVVVMDFGLARLGGPESESESESPSVTGLGPGPSPFSTALTFDGVIMGTPAYMAPEQHAGATADARADQFSLCASLFEMVVGRRPFVGQSVAELADRKRRAELDPRDPRLPVSRGLWALLRRGLDPEPARRFGSMDELRQQLLRLRRRPPRWRAAWVAVAVLTVGGTAAAALWPQEPSACEAAAARMGDSWNDATRAQLRDAFEATGLPYAAEESGRTIERLDAYASAWTSAHGRACEAARRSESEVASNDLDRRMACLTTARRSLDATVALLVHADAQAVQRAVSQVAELPLPAHCDDVEALRAAAAQPDDPQVRAAIDELEVRIEGVRALDRAARFDEGLAQAQSLLDDARALGHEPTIARAQIRLASLAQGAGDPERAHTLLSEAALLAAGAGDHPAAADAATRLVFLCAEDLGRPDEAMRWARHAEASLERMPDDALAHARLQGNLATVYSTTGDYAKALELYERAYEAKRAVLGDEHPEVAGSLENIGLSYGELGRPQEAVEIHRRSAATMEAVLGAHHPGYAHSLMNLGHAVDVLGQHDEAVQHYTHALQVLRESLGPRHFMVARALASLGHVASAQDRLPDADAYYREAAEIVEAVFGEQHREHAWLLADRAVVMSQMSRDEEALRLARRAREILEAVQGAEHDSVAYVLMDEAAALVELERTDEAEAALDRAGTILRARFDADHPVLGSYHANRGELLEARQDLEGARRELLTGLEISRAALGDEHPEIASTLLTLGEVEHDMQRLDDARAHLRSALAILEAAPVGEAFRAATRFALGKVQWTDPATRAEARALVLQAREGFASYGEIFVADVEEIDAWLARHR